MAPTSRRWDAVSYDRISGPMTQMAAAVLDRLPLSGDETVLDAGCGTGRVTEMLLDRLPRGRVVAVDADPAMVEVARENVAGRRVDVIQSDLLELELDVAVDAVLSTATFHWLHDHQRLFDRLYGSLRPGGRLVAQCGGQGNIAEIRRVGSDLTTDPTFAPWFETWDQPWYYAGADETTRRLEAAGFVDTHVWLEPWPVVPDDPAEYLTTIVLGAQVQRLPEKLRGRYVEAVMDRLDPPVTVGYVRLNMDAIRPT